MSRRMKLKPNPRSIATRLAEIGHDPNDLSRIGGLHDKLAAFDATAFAAAWPRDCRTLASLTYDVACHLVTDTRSEAWRRRWAAIGGELARTLIGASGSDKTGAAS